MKRSLVIAIAVLAVLAAAFFLLNFRLMNSQTGMNSGTASGGSEGFKKSPKFAPAATGLYVEGTGPMADAVRARVKQAIQRQDYVGEVSMINLMADRLDLPVMYIEMIPVRHFWSPVYASSEYQMNVSYATNGDVSFRNQAAPHFVMDGNPPALQFKAMFTLTDTSTGLISYQGYQDYLVEKMVTLVRETLQKQVGMEQDWHQPSLSRRFWGLAVFILHHFNKSKLKNAPTPGPSPKSGRGDSYNVVFSPVLGRKNHKKVFPALGRGAGGWGKSVCRELLRLHINLSDWGGSSKRTLYTGT